MIQFQVRTTKVLSDSELSISLRGGWDENLPAIKDEHGNLLVGNRRMAIAKRDGIDPVIKVVTFGDGPEADAARIRLANVSNIGGAPMTKEDRQRQAVRLYESGLTMEAIGDMLGVSHKTISLDLAGVICTKGTNQKPAKTETNPKGAGRPKGSGKKAKAAKETKPVVKKIAAPAPTKTKDEKGRVAGVDIKVDPEVWREFNDRARGENKSATTLINELVTGTVSPPIDPSTLSLSAQDKLNIAIKQATRKLEVEIEHRVRQENLKWLQKQLDQYNENAAHYEAVMKSRKGGVLTSAEFKLVWSCLHTDSRKSVSDERLNKAFNLFSKLEKLILSEAESPTKGAGLPKTATDLMRQKAEYQAQRAAERAAKKGTTSNVDRR